MSETLSSISYIFIFSTLYFEVFLLISFFEKNHTKGNISFTPPVTVIVPCYNEETTIADTLRSILGLRYPKDNLKILVVNDGSTDGTEKILSKFRGHPQIEIHTKENGGKYTALNFGIEKSKTEYIGCLDADSFVDKEALSRIMSHFANSKVMAVTPAMVIHEPNTMIRSMQRAEYHYGNFIRRALSLINAIHITPGPFSFFRKEVFETIGMYRHAHNTEDMEMAMRMQKHGMIIENEPHALVYTVGPANVKKLYKQRERWVSGFLGNLIDYRDMLFKKEYGDLGMVVLPFASFALIMTMIYISLTVFHVSVSAYNTFYRMYSIGITHQGAPHFDWFYINTSTISFLTILLTAITFSLVLIGQKMVTGKWRLTLDSLYFVFIYSFIAPFWLSKAIYNNIRSKDANWR